ncbi:MAG: DJ-1 family glyoxalase III [Halanaerobiaceae bacterium]
MDKIVIPLAEGMEEIEAVTPIDVLRRAGLEVKTCYVGESSRVTGDHEIIIEADSNIKDLQANKVGGLVLPGGIPGATNLKNSKELIKLIKAVDKDGGLLAANCAAPIVLEAAGVLKDRQATSYPGFDEQMPSCIYQEERVVIDGNVITARGPGVALEFSLALVEYLLDEGAAKNLQQKMMAN